MENRNRMAFCINCGDQMPCKINVGLVQINVRGVEFECIEYSAKCLRCGAAMYVPEINDKNVDIRTEAYKKAKEGR